MIDKKIDEIREKIIELESELEEELSRYDKFFD